jgi:drug/metabolite transporter (DMT)-like permease
MTAAKPPRWLVDSSLIGVCFIWGATFILVKRALADISTLFFLTFRFTAAAAVLALIFYKQFRSPKLRMSVRAGLLAGLCLFGGYVLQTFGLKYTTASKTGFITGLYIPLVPLFGSIVYKKIPQISELCGVGAAFAGMALMTIQTDITDINRGDLLVAGCAVVYAWHILLLGHFTGSANLGVLIVTQIATGMAVGMGTFWWAEPMRVQWTSNVWIALVVTSLLATALAFSIQTWAQRWSSPTRTALIFSMEPVFAWAASYLLAGEVLSRRGTFGAALILAGILIVELKLDRLCRKHHTLETRNEKPEN